jgi:hypothetical protein
MRISSTGKYISLSLVTDKSTKTFPYFKMSKDHGNPTLALPHSIAEFSANK